MFAIMLSFIVCIKCRIVKHVTHTNIKVRKLLKKHQ